MGYQTDRPIIFTLARLPDFSHGERRLHRELSKKLATNRTAAHGTDVAVGGAFPFFNSQPEDSQRRSIEVCFSARRTEGCPVVRHAFRLSVFCVLLLPAQLFASPITIDFENLNDGNIIATQYAGLTFSNAIALTAGVSVNEFELPPHSGSNVASDNGGPMRIDFAQPVSDVGGYFTYGVPLSLKAFDSNGTVLGSASSLFSSNFALSGDLGSSSNELLQLAFGGISYVTFAGDPAGGSFALDDLTYSPDGGPAPVPEPGTLLLMATGGLALVRTLRSGANKDRARA
jgi:hypothetical protein